MAEKGGVTLASLTDETLRFVFVRLPVDARARAAAVCRLWRDVLKDRDLWTRLDLSRASGVPRVTDAMLRGAAAKAGGGLTALDITLAPFVTRDALMEVAATNWGVLTELNCSITFTHAELEALFRAAPLLCEFRAKAHVTGVAVGPLLRCEPPFGPLRIVNLQIHSPWPSNEATMRVFAAELSANVSPMLALCLMDPPPFADGAFDELVDVALERQFETFQLCGLRSVTSASSLSRLLSCKSLQLLHISGPSPNETMLITGLQSSATLIAAALDMNKSLILFSVEAAGILSDAAAAEALLRALSIAHPRLSIISFQGNPAAAADRARIGASLGALVANTRIGSLNLSGCNLGDEGLGLLVDALKISTTLHTLACSDNDISEKFAHQRLRPAILANTSLRLIQLVPSVGGSAGPAYLRELEQLVNDRVAERRLTA